MFFTMFLVFLIIAFLGMWLFGDDPFLEGMGCFAPFCGLLIGVFLLTNQNLFFVLTLPMLFVYMFCLVRDTRKLNNLRKNQENEKEDY